MPSLHDHNNSAKKVVITFKKDIREARGRVSEIKQMLGNSATCEKYK
jgi:hypothetical protein